MIQFVISNLFSYDVIFTTPLEDILDKFKSFDAKVVFGAERLLWPKQSLEKLYPAVVANAAKYLNSGLFMGEFYILEWGFMWSSFALVVQEIYQAPNIVILHEIRTNN